ncbi:MAG: hypothetical protein ABJP45_10775 [Cyclobacteriaceae bacterium]
MRRKFLTMMVIVSALSLGACTEDAAMDELIDDIELNQPGDNDDDDKDPPGGVISGGSGGG